MRKTVALLCLVAFCLPMLTGCATVLVNAPPDKDVRLLAESDPTSFKSVKRTWYVLWGLVPISSNSTADVIAEHRLKNVRVKTYYDVVDWLISMVLGFVTIHSRTIEIDGTR